MSTATETPEVRAHTAEERHDHVTEALQKAHAGETLAAMITRAPHQGRAMMLYGMLAMLANNALGDTLRRLCEEQLAPLMEQVGGEPSGDVDTDLALQWLSRIDGLKEGYAQLGGL